MWALIIAAGMGIFSSLFGLAGDPLSEASRPMTQFEDRYEYKNSWFDDGFQTNEEPQGLPDNPRIIDTNTEEGADGNKETAATVAVGSESLIDVRTRTTDGNKANADGDVITVLKEN